MRVRLSDRQTVSHFPFRRPQVNLGNWKQLNEIIRNKLFRPFQLIASLRNQLSGQLHFKDSRRNQLSGQIYLKDSTRQLSGQLQSIDSTQNQLSGQFQLITSLRNQLSRRFHLIDSRRNPLPGQFQWLYSQNQLSGQFQSIPGREHAQPIVDAIELSRVLWHFRWRRIVSPYLVLEVFFTAAQAVPYGARSDTRPLSASRPQPRSAQIRSVRRVFAIYQILLGSKTYKYYYETHELPNPRPTQPKKY